MEFNESNFNIQFVNETWIIGTNKSSDGLINKSLVPKKLFIPNKIGENYIQEIGKNAFINLNIEEIIISEGIKQINTYAFGHLPNLTSVILPPSIIFIGYCGIHCYNNSAPEGSKTAKGTLTVTFSGDSKIEYLSQYSISRKERIIVYFMGKKSPICHDNIYFREVIKTVKVYSVHMHSLGGVRSSIFISQRTCRRRNIINVFITILLSYK